MVGWTLHRLGNRDEVERPLSSWKLGGESFNFFQKWWPPGAATRNEDSEPQGRRVFPQDVSWALGLHAAAPAARERAGQVPCLLGRLRLSRGVPPRSRSSRRAAVGKITALLSRPFSTLIFS